jgi:hypothetical protein
VAVQDVLSPRRVRTSSTSIKVVALPWAQPSGTEGGSGCPYREPVKRRWARLYSLVVDPQCRGHEGRRDVHTQFHGAGVKSRVKSAVNVTRSPSTAPSMAKSTAFGRLTPRPRPSWSSPGCRRGRGRAWCRLDHGDPRAALPSVANGCPFRGGTNLGDRPVRPWRGPLVLLGPHSRAPARRERLLVWHRLPLLSFNRAAASGAGPSGLPGRARVACRVTICTRRR